jgi:hypothetical protein
MHEFKNLPTWKTKQIKKGLGESMHTLTKKERNMEGGRRDSSPSTEKREWRAGAPNTDICVVNGANETKTLRAFLPP